MYQSDPVTSQHNEACKISQPFRCSIEKRHAALLLFDNIHRHCHLSKRNPLGRFLCTFLQKWERSR